LHATGVIDPAKLDSVQATYELQPTPQSCDLQAEDALRSNTWCAVSVAD
jgi:hypothetical protein